MNTIIYKMESFLELGGDEEGYYVSGYLGSVSGSKPLRLTAGADV